MAIQQSINNAFSAMAILARLSPVGDIASKKAVETEEARKQEALAKAKQENLERARKLGEQGRIAETPAELEVQTDIARKITSIHQTQFEENPTDEKYETLVKLKRDVAELERGDPSVRSYKTPSEIKAEENRAKAERAKIEEQARQRNYSPEDWLRHFEKVKLDAERQNYEKKEEDING